MTRYRFDDRAAWPGAKLTVEGPLLHVPVSQPPQEVQQYSLGHCMQVSPTQVAMLAGRRVTNFAITDYENGWDVVIFDDLSQITEQAARAVVANTIETHPRTGQQLAMIHHVPIGGFVPRGARLDDGRPHPHAGTGFGLAVVHGYPADNSVHNAHIASDMHQYMVLYQFAFDGKQFSIADAQVLNNDQVMPGWWVMNRGLAHAIPDGEDLLFGMVAGREGEVSRAHAKRLADAGRTPYIAAHKVVGECYGSGLSRWRRGENGWRPVSYTPVPVEGPDMAFEPSVVRDADGALLMTMRGRGANVPPGESDCGLVNYYEHVRVYRSTDNGSTWQSVICEPEVRAPTPTSIIKAADGSLMIAANPYRPLEHDARGKAIMKQKQRDQLWLWRISDDRRSLGSPVPLLNCRDAFGPARDLTNGLQDNRWYADHPVGGAFRLADGKLHTFIGFRLTDAATTSGGGGVAEPSGAWLAEIHTSDNGAFDWRF